MRRGGDAGGAEPAVAPGPGPRPGSMGCIGSKTTIVAVDTTLCVEWKEVKVLSPLSAARPLPRLVRQASFDSQDFLQVNVEDTVEMLPKSRRALTIQEIAALARSSLHGISQVVKEHVTKPTAMAQGRVAHLIEWKGWCKPVEPPTALESAFSSYCHLSEGEQEARFAAGVAEQFAIAEAKLRAWSSVDGDDSNDESYDEDFMPYTESSQTTDLPSALLRDLLQGHLCQLGLRHSSCEPESDSSHTLSPETLCSSLCSLEMVSPSELTAKLLGSLGGEDLLLPKLSPPARQSALRGLARLRCQDSLYSVSYAEACVSPAEEEVVLSKDFPLRRKVSDVASSGVASLEEEEEAEEP
ncbi:LOW QUALITY PROTEIN: protein FAM131A [Phaenicophaeus curvirostris]|uniref:LOW QUALITY PROTEIN: protein FAM131A n=1 Tax=Phaenicophaeus curvirostris TaxID=33595 RepID=UPI0037F0FCE4